MKWRFGWLAIATAFIIILGTGHRNLLQVDAAHAQRINPKTVAAQVYKQHPEFPLENQYKRQRSGDVVTDSTLVSRLIEYHTLVKGRAPNFRLDWKATLADYLGLNDYLREGEYPGHAYLRSNPMERDIATISAFNRQQRADLVQALATAYSQPEPAAPPALPQTTAPAKPSISVPPPTNQQPTLQPLPPSNGADLLRIPAPSQPQPAKPTGEARFLLP